jgi:hypothetical protein
LLKEGREAKGREGKGRGRGRGREGEGKAEAKEVAAAHLLQGDNEKGRGRPRQANLHVLTSGRESQAMPGRKGMGYTPKRFK